MVVSTEAILPEECRHGLYLKRKPQKYQFQLPHIRFFVLSLLVIINLGKNWLISLIIPVSIYVPFFCKGHKFIIFMTQYYSIVCINIYEIFSLSSHQLVAIWSDFIVLIIVNWLAITMAVQITFFLLITLYYVTPFYRYWVSHRLSPGFKHLIPPTLICLVPWASYLTFSVSCSFSL